MKVKMKLKLTKQRRKHNFKAPLDTMGICPKGQTLAPAQHQLCGKCTASGSVVKAIITSL